MSKTFFLYQIDLKETVLLFYCETYQTLWQESNPRPYTDKKLIINQSIMAPAYFHINLQITCLIRSILRKYFCRFMVKHIRVFGRNRTHDLYLEKLIINQFIMAPAYLHINQSTKVTVYLHINLQIICLKLHSRRCILFILVVQNFRIYKTISHISITKLLKVLSLLTFCFQQTYGQTDGHFPIDSELLFLIQNSKDISNIFRFSNQAQK